MRSRPSWDEYFLDIAKVVSTRSMDAQTQHGCVIVNQDKHIIGTGYNSFPRGMRDDELPNTRPDKYIWMIHSEINALNNCVLRPKDGTAYITGEPCNNCLFQLYQNGVAKIIYKDSHGTFLMTDEDREIRKIFLSQVDLELVRWAIKEDI